MSPCFIIEQNKRKNTTNHSCILFHPLVRCVAHTHRICLGIDEYSGALFEAPKILYSIYLFDCQSTQPDQAIKNPLTGALDCTHKKTCVKKELLGWGWPGDREKNVKKQGRNDSLESLVSSRPYVLHRMRKTDLFRDRCAPSFGGCFHTFRMRQKVTWETRPIA